MTNKLEIRRGDETVIIVSDRANIICEQNRTELYFVDKFQAKG